MNCPQKANSFDSSSFPVQHAPMLVLKVGRTVGSHVLTQVTPKLELVMCCRGVELRWDFSDPSVTPNTPWCPAS
eukprot:2580965-Rhodomonas_salina.1